MNKFFKIAKDKNEVYLLYFIDKERMHMIKQLAWNTFKNTGDINTFMELMQVQNIEKNLKVNEEYGNYQNQGDNIIGK